MWWGFGAGGMGACEPDLVHFLHVVPVLQCMYLSMSHSKPPQGLPWRPQEPAAACFSCSLSFGCKQVARPVKKTLSKVATTLLFHIGTLISKHDFTLRRWLKRTRPDKVVLYYFLTRVLPLVAVAACSMALGLDAWGAMLCATSLQIEETNSAATARRGRKGYYATHPTRTYYCNGIQPGMHRQHGNFTTDFFL